MKHIFTIVLLMLTTSIIAQITSWNEYKLKEHWKTNGADEIEGIYLREAISTLYIKNKQPENNSGVVDERYFIVREGEKYILSSFSGGFKGKLTKAPGQNKYFMETNSNIWGPKDEKITVILNRINQFELVVDNYQLYIDSYYKAIIRDKFSMIWQPENDAKSERKSSGTGFAISSNGVIVTNFHLIEGAKSINIRGVNSNFSKIYKAKVLVSDKNNDLALIQIDDNDFTTLGTIPFTIKIGLAGVGENIFVLGYPLRSTMGDEIKLTNGVVSSRTGFQGDITSYQISAPVQPGSSGGPLFDIQGNLIGIINAKHVNAENASYAVKTSYLINLIDLLSISPKLQTVNSMTGKTLTQQVDLVKKFVYIIEIE